MFAIERDGNFLHRAAEFCPPVEPCAMHAVAGAVNIASPNPFQAHDHIAFQPRTKLLDLVSKLRRRFAGNLRQWTKWPLVSRPFRRGHEMSLMPGVAQTAGESFEI